MTDIISQAVQISSEAKGLPIERLLSVKKAMERVAGYAELLTAYAAFPHNPNRTDKVFLFLKTTSGLAYPMFTVINEQPSDDIARKFYEPYYNKRDTNSNFPYGELQLICKIIDDRITSPTSIEFTAGSDKLAIIKRLYEEMGMTSIPQGIEELHPITALASYGATRIAPSIVVTTGL